MTITWNTKKNTNGTFSYIVKKVIGTQEMQANGNYAITTVLKTGTVKTRAQAKSKAIQWCKYLKSTIK